MRNRGFTIIELLIVIVVIGILAAITLVTYSGIKERSTNASITSSLASWIKGLQLYKADKGSWPLGMSCLGSGYPNGLNGNGTVADGQCRQSGASVYRESPTFLTAMTEYMNGSTPTPPFVVGRFSDTEWRRGFTYVYGGGSGTDVYIMAIYLGKLASCPLASGVSGSPSIYGENTYCFYLIGKTTD